MRPPELRIAHAHGQSLTGGGHELGLDDALTVGIIERERPLHSLLIGIENRADGQIDGAIDVLLHILHGLHSAGIPELQIDVAPDAQIRELWTPVPAEHIMCLAQMREARNGVLLSPERVLLLLSGDIGKGRIELDLERILVAELVRDVEAPAAVHIVRMPQQLAVECDVCNGVDAVEAERDVRGHFRRTRKRCGKQVVLLGKRVRLALILAVVWALDRLVRDQCVVYRTGDGTVIGFRVTAPLHCPDGIQH